MATTLFGSPQATLRRFISTPRSSSLRPTPSSLLQHIHTTTLANGRIADDEDGVDSAEGVALVTSDSGNHLERRRTSRRAGTEGLAPPPVEGNSSEGDSATSGGIALNGTFVPGHHVKPRVLCCWCVLRAPAAATAAAAAQRTPHLTRRSMRGYLGLRGCCGCSFTCFSAVLACALACAFIVTFILVLALDIEVHAYRPVHLLSFRGTQNVLLSIPVFLWPSLLFGTGVAVMLTMLGKRRELQFLVVRGLHTTERRLFLLTSPVFATGAALLVGTPPVVLLCLIIVLAAGSEFCWIIAELQMYKEASRRSMYRGTRSRATRSPPVLAQTLAAGSDTQDTRSVSISISIPAAIPEKCCESPRATNDDSEDDGDDDDDAAPTSVAATAAAETTAGAEAVTAAQAQSLWCDCNFHCDDTGRDGNDGDVGDNDDSSKSKSRSRSRNWRQHSGAHIKNGMNIFGVHIAGVRHDPPLWRTPSCISAFLVKLGVCLHTLVVMMVMAVWIDADASDATDRFEPNVSASALVHVSLLSFFIGALFIALHELRRLACCSIRPSTRSPESSSPLATHPLQNVLVRVIPHVLFALCLFFDVIIFHHSPPRLT